MTEKVFIKDYFKKQHMFQRINDEIINMDYIVSIKPSIIGTYSLANVCRIGDKVNGHKVIALVLGMNFCYCVHTEDGHTFYSWNIETIETKLKKYKVVECKDKVLVKEERNDNK